jgi:hypothetical protein
VQFVKNDSTMKYDLIVHNVQPIDLELPKLEFKKFELPNTQFIEFHWKDERKEGYPISFSVTNSNPYYKVYNIDSYAIPELNKVELKPNFWQKLAKFSKSTGGKIAFFGVGVVTGAVLVNSVSN